MLLFHLLRRGLMGSVHRLRLAYWYVRHPDVFGVHAVALSPQGRVILVRQSYRKGWHLPGGATKPGKSLADNVLRELREEIGLVRAGEPQFLFEDVQVNEYRPDHCSIFLLRDCIYRPKRFDLEIEAVIEAAPDALPGDLDPRARRWIDRALGAQ